MQRGARVPLQLISYAKMELQQASLADFPNQ